MLSSPEPIKSRRKRKTSQKNHSNLVLNQITPLTDNQREAFVCYYDGLHLVLHGVAGTGKTFIGMYLALDSVLNKHEQQKVIIVRSAVPGRQQGYLPGNEKEKARIFELPYKEIASNILNRGDAYEVLKSKGVVEFNTTSYLRGMTFENCILLVDEIQNMNEQELHTIMTRIGMNTRIILCGDFRQDDLTSERYNEHSGIDQFLNIIEDMDDFGFIEFDVDDIVRSGFVKSYILARIKNGLN